MLMQFVVENFRSFRGKVVLSLIEAEGIEHTEPQSAGGEASSLRPRCDNVHMPPRVLRCAAIYGANASGKSNLVKALSFARRLVVSGMKSDHLINVSPFKRRGSCSDPGGLLVQLLPPEHGVLVGASGTMPR